jgi:cytochrome o ubiquinol oxidase subunit II
MKKKLALYMVIFIGVITLVTAIIMLSEFFYDKDFEVLHPKGLIATQEKNLLWIATVLMLIVVIPVFVIMFFVAWKYRESHPNTKYTPNLKDSVLAEIIWWGVPCVIVGILSVLTWIRTHDLDPYKSIAHDKKEMKIQVVALQWKWLFIYPEQQLATVNYLQIPEKTPIRFEITSDAPMNSFWIPSLGGQMYAMPGMRTNLNLIADETGEFRGVSANISGEGFAGMKFLTKSTTEEEFANWVQEMKNAPYSLGMNEYNQLAAPSQNNPVALYTLSEPELFDRIIMKYMMP